MLKQCWQKSTVLSQKSLKRIQILPGKSKLEILTNFTSPIGLTTVKTKQNKKTSVDQMETIAEAAEGRQGSCTRLLHYLILYFCHLK